MDLCRTLPASAGFYQPLDPAKQEFRVLVVQPGPPSERIQARLEPASFNSQPAYETISYCWGDASLKSSIELNGINIVVPASSLAALAKMRSKDNERVLWMDAICINQEDITERAQQVQMMRQIYSRSTGNLIYLGEGDGTTRSALTSLQNVYLDLERETANFSNLDGTLLKAGTEPVKAATKLTCEADISALKTFFSLPWFRRLWVFQEVILAPSNTCYIGSFDFSFLLPVRTAMWLFGNKVVEHELIQILYKCNCSLAFHYVDRSFGSCAKGATPRMENLMSATLYLLATNPRDYVYGMLGIHQNVDEGTLHPLLIPDYTKSTAGVFRDATRYLIEVRDYVRIWIWIHWNDEAEFNRAQMPSWAIDWSQLSLKGSMNPYLIRFNAGCEGALARSISFSELDADVVSVKGLCYAKVMDRTPILSNDIQRDSGSDKLLSWFEQCINEAYGVLPLGDVHNTLSSVLTAFDNGRYLPEHQRLDAMVAFARDLGLDTQRSQLIFSSADSHEPASQSMLSSCFSKALSYTCTDRRMFVTSTGHLGIGPLVLDIGDVVAVFSGFHAPYVLRPVGQDYRIVGASYVHGIMEGEAMREYDSRGDEGI